MTLHYNNRKNPLRNPRNMNISHNIAPHARKAHHMMKPINWMSWLRNPNNGKRHKTFPETVPAPTSLALLHLPWHPSRSSPDHQTLQSRKIHFLGHPESCPGSRSARETHHKKNQSNDLGGDIHSTSSPSLQRTLSSCASTVARHSEVLMAQILRRPSAEALTTCSPELMNRPYRTPWVCPWNVCTPQPPKGTHTRWKPNTHIPCCIYLHAYVYGGHEHEYSCKQTYTYEYTWTYIHTHVHKHMHIYTWTY